MADHFFVAPFGLAFDWSTVNPLLRGVPDRAGYVNIKIGGGGVEEARQVIPHLQKWLEEGKINLKDMICKVISLEEIPQAIEDLQRRPKSLIKIVIKP